MKKLLAIIVLSLLWHGNANAEKITMNKLLEDKYTITKQELIKFEEDAFKIFTLRKGKNIMICSVHIEIYGIESSSECMKP